MSEIYERETDRRKITVYKGRGEGLPVLYCNDDMECGKTVTEYCGALSAPAFHLVTISGFDWNRDMFPWPADSAVTKNDHFAGGGPEYLKWLLERAIPCAEDLLHEKGSASFIAGYSLAGLFALWSLYETDFFQGAVCASGSLWYPEFYSFAMSHEFLRKPQRIYLSLGDRESSGKNPVFRRTEPVCRELSARYRNAGIPSVFELNPGNHYADAEKRLAKGITWLLNDKNTLS